MTLLLSGADIEGLMRPSDYLEAVETGFRAGAEGRAAAPAPMAVAGEGGSFHAKGASLRLDRLYVALKLNGNFPGNPPALPTIQGAILLCDGADGRLLAVMDSIEVTLRRTAAATALAARYLARPDSETVLVCGCGMQATAQIEALAEVLPLRRCFAWDRDLRRAETFAREAERLFRLEARPVSAIEAVARDCDVIVTCTTAREAFLMAGHAAPGCFVAGVGADSPEKNEIHPDLMAKARVVVDVLDQCVEMGDLRHAIRAGAMRPGDVHAGLGALVAGTDTGRTDEDQIFVFDSTGTALQDVAAAAAIYERGTRRGGYPSFEFGDSRR
ncbi:MAG TPA: ornithine cyclodeaminase family protein [Allosphingosinicella sp.]|nr:ornithine cyclodeaminase family protein [Allosphingosinicella sp.]